MKKIRQASGVSGLLKNDRMHVLGPYSDAAASDRCTRTNRGWMEVVYGRFSQVRLAQPTAFNLGCYEAWRLEYVFFLDS